MTATGGDQPGQQPVARPGTAPRIVFDDPLDGPAPDDSDAGWGGRPSPSDARDLDWYLAEKPPHHG